LVKKAWKANLITDGKPRRRLTKTGLAQQLFTLAEHALKQGWSAEELLCAEIRKRERQLRQRERQSLRI
jgi:hypothetical protein